jgi:hypothetical protein
MTAANQANALEPPRRRLRLLDLIALVVGFGMAGLLIKAFWPRFGPLPSAPIAVALAILYLWLGLAMAGPLVLLLDRRGSEAFDGPGRYSWAERAWILIGVYWVGLTVLIVPTRMPVTSLLGVFPVAAGLILRLFGRPADVPGPIWTHRTAVALLLTWPVVWADLILLFHTLM